MNYTQKITKSLAKKMKFDVWGEEDIGQEVYFLILQAQEVYDPKKIDNDYVFYYNFVKNRLHTLKRDNYLKKQNVLDTISMDYDVEQEFETYLDLYRDLIDGAILASMRADYLRFKEGVKIPYRNKLAIIDSIKKIVRNIQDEEQ